RDVDLRLHRLAGLTDLQRVRHPARVDDRTRRTPRTLELLGEFLDERCVVLGGTDPASAGNDNGRLLELRSLLLLDVVLDDLRRGRPPRLAGTDVRALGRAAPRRLRRERLRSYRDEVRTLTGELRVDERHAAEDRGTKAETAVGAQRCAVGEHGTVELRGQTREQIAAVVALRDENRVRRLRT